jgi:hypothetical protein
MTIRFSSKDIRHHVRKFSIIGLIFPVILGCSTVSIPADSGGTDETVSSGKPTDRKTIEYNTPGHYTFREKCFFTVTMTMEGGGPADPVPEFRTAELWVCLNGVLVGEDLTMRFEIEYTMKPTDPEAGPVWRDSDRGNKNVFLTDDKDGRYKVSEAGGCAAEEMRTEKESLTCTGWFLFPPINPGATIFEFHYATAQTVEGSDSIRGIEFSEPD